MGAPAGVVVVGLGPGDPAVVTPAALAALAGARRAFVAGGGGAGAGVVAGLGLPYPAAPGGTPAEVVEVLVAAAGAGGVALGVLGSPLVLEPVVELLAADGRVALEVVPGLSFCELAWARLGLDPVRSGARVAAVGDLARLGPPASGPLLVAGGAGGDVGVADHRGGGQLGPHGPSGAGRGDVGVAGHARGGQIRPDGPAAGTTTTAADLGGAPWRPEPGDEWPERAIVLHRLGLPGERVEEMAFAEAVAAVLADDVTSLFVPVPVPARGSASAGAAAAAGAELARLATLVATLRERCPWDREQTHRSLVRHLLEEAYEAIEAIEALDTPPSPEQAAHLEEELGDLLCQVYFHATLAAEYGAFDLAGVAHGLRRKLVARHPHVFGDKVADDAAWVVANWERGKLREKGRSSLMDGIPPATPALAATAKVERKASGAGLGIDVTGEGSELPALLDAVRSSPSDDEQVGELLFRVARLAAHAGCDPEAAVRGAVARYKRRFAAAEEAAAAADAALHDLPPGDRLRIWHAANFDPNFNRSNTTP